jgi:4-oxalocrotonate tautomerase
MLIYRDDVLSIRGESLPIVQLSVWSGMSLENKKKVVQGITRVLEEIGIPRDAVTVVIYEAPKEDWASGGQLHSERFAAVHGHLP